MISVENRQLSCLLFRLILEQFLDTSNTAHHICRLERQINRFLIVIISELFHHGDILLRKQIVGRIGALAHCLSNLFDGNRLCLSLTDACSSLTFRSQNSLLRLCLSTVDSTGFLSFRTAG